MGKLAKVLRIKVILLPLEMYCLFHIANLFLNFSSTPSWAAMDLKGAPNDNPKYEEGRLLTLQPSSVAIASAFGINSFLSKLILNLEMASNHISVQLKYVIWSWEAP